MIGTDDIRAAVASGLLTEAQAASLTSLAHSRKGAREDLDPGDEPFELFRGFNEIFVMVGLLILTTGWSGVVSAMIVGEIGLEGLMTEGLSSWLDGVIIYAIVTAVLLWILAEYFIRNRRMVGPAILLTILFASNAATGFGVAYGELAAMAQGSFASLILPGLLTVSAVFVFWLRFKVPFAMALMALGLFATALIAAAGDSAAPRGIRDIFILSARSNFGWVTLALGIVTFAAAMAFDGSDPHRVTRRSAQGFWLHLVAAPMIINTVALSLLSNQGAATAPIILAAMAVFAIVAVVIDRRSFLLAAIAYVLFVLSTVSPAFDNTGGARLILGLGVFLVILGAFWARIRGGLLKALPLGRFRAYLPPAH